MAVIGTPHEAANLVACQIVNLLADCPGGKAELYGQIYRLLAKMLHIVGEEQAERWKTPSDN
jgi:hypothetical protein